MCPLKLNTPYFFFSSLQVREDDDDDGDTLPNWLDLDINGNDVMDHCEVPNTNPVKFIDTDKDGIPDHKDPDVDGDGVPNDRDPDDDNDGRYARLTFIFTF